MTWADHWIAMHRRGIDEVRKARAAGNMAAVVLWLQFCCTQRQMLKSKARIPGVVP